VLAGDDGVVNVRWERATQGEIEIAVLEVDSGCEKRPAFMVSSINFSC
jgi:hypothetical protein